VYTYRQGGVEDQGQELVLMVSIETVSQASKKHLGQAIAHDFHLYHESNPSNQTFLEELSVLPLLVGQGVFVILL
jgi:hypothetical protein